MGSSICSMVFARHGSESHSVSRYLVSFHFLEQTQASSFVSALGGQGAQFDIS
ncbi:MAG: hypothetical protein M1493_09540 [Firmicutes bacterium]|nr:hypothetical protein [Bacillota bacterium]